jgi:iron complex outermembrane receptor protein
MLSGLIRITKDFFGNERMQWSFNPTGSYLWNRNLTRTYNEQNYGSVQANLNGEFSTGKVKHKLLFGADADYLQSDNYTYYFQKQDGSWENSGSIGYGTNGKTKLNPPTINLADESTGQAVTNLQLQRKILQEHLQDVLAFTFRFNFCYRKIKSSGWY